MYVDGLAERSGKIQARVGQGEVAVIELNRANGAVVVGDDAAGDGLAAGARGNGQVRISDEASGAGSFQIARCFDGAGDDAVIADILSGEGPGCGVQVEVSQIRVQVHAAHIGHGDVAGEFAAEGVELQSVQLDAMGIDVKSGDEVDVAVPLAVLAKGEITAHYVAGDQVFLVAAELGVGVQMHDAFGPLREFEEAAELAERKTAFDGQRALTGGVLQGAGCFDARFAERKPAGIDADAVLVHVDGDFSIDDAGESFSRLIGDFQSADLLNVSQRDFSVETRRGRRRVHVLDGSVENEPGVGRADFRVVNGEAVLGERDGYGDVQIERLMIGVVDDERLY